MDEHRLDPADENRPEKPAHAEQQGAPLGGDDATEEQLEADNAVEEDMLKGLDPHDAPA